MKIAVLASGFLHGAADSAKNFRECVLEPLGADLYVFTSKENVSRRADGSKYTSWLTASDQHKLMQAWKPFLKAIEFTEDDRSYSDHLSSTLAVYSQRLENFKPVCPPEYVKHEYRMSCIDQYLRLAYCCEMLEGDYDVVVRARPDLVFESPLSIDNVRSSTLYVPCKEAFYNPETSETYLKEFLFWGKRSVMEKICKNWVHAYGIPEPLFAPGGSDYTLCPEHQFGLYVKSLGLQVEFVPLTCRYSEEHRAYEVIKNWDRPGENRVQF